MIEPASTRDQPRVHASTARLRPSGALWLPGEDDGVERLHAWTAHALGYQAQLGAPWFSVSGAPVYPPYAIFWWWFSYEAYAPRIFETGGMIAASGGLIAVVVAIAMSVWRAREARTSATYGSARWATRSEIAREGLLGGKGAVIGRHANLYLRHDGPEHVLCFAPTRSGKGVGLVVPTLLTWPHSAIVHDIKGENWDLTAGFRSRFSRVLLFDPTNGASARPAGTARRTRHHDGTGTERSRTLVRSQS